MMLRERWLITGASGQLGGHVTRRLVLENRGAAVLALAGARDVAATGATVARVDLADTDALREAVAGFRPTHVIHTAAMTAVGDCFANPAMAERLNVDGTRALAEATAECGGRFVFTSTDMVFDGTRAPYGEHDAPTPVSVYGRTKAAAERAVAALPNALIVRLPLLYGFPLTNRPNTFVQQIAALRAGQPLRLFHDEYRTPVWVPDAALALIALARSERRGMIHVAGPERVSRLALVERFAQLLGIANPNVQPVSRLSVEGAEPRPEDLSLDATRLRQEFPSIAPGPIRQDVFMQIAR